MTSRQRLGHAAQFWRVRIPRHPRYEPVPSQHVYAIALTGMARLQGKIRGKIAFSHFARVKNRLIANPSPAGPPPVLFRHAPREFPPRPASACGSTSSVPTGVRSRFGSVRTLIWPLAVNRRALKTRGSALGFGRRRWRIGCITHRKGSATRGRLWRRLIMLICAGWLPHFICPSRGCLVLSSEITRRIPT